MLLRRMTSVKQKKKISWVLERFTTATKMSWKRVNRFVTGVFLHYFDFISFNTWFSSISSFQQKKTSKLKVLRKLKSKVSHHVWRKRDFTLIAVGALKTREWFAHLLLSFFPHQSKIMRLQSEDPPGATSSDYLSEAAKVSLHFLK